MKSVVVRAVEVAISLVKHRRNQEKKDDGEKKCLFLPLFGMIGDGVLFMDALSGYLSYFHDELGYDIVIGCRRQVGELIKLVYPDKAYEIIEMDRNRMQKSVREFWDCLNRLNGYDFDIIINVRERMLDENILIYALSASRKITFRNNTKEPKAFVSRFFHRNTYGGIFYADPDSEQYRRYGKLLKELGYSGYKSHVSRIPVISGRMAKSKPYFVVSPGASSEKKCWPQDRFSEICDKIIEEYNLDLYISGSDIDQKYADTIKVNMKNRDRVYNYCGSTEMDEWIELLRNARIVISNDSASVHIAASVQTPAVCIAPQHDGFRFLPYQPDEVMPDDVLPYSVRCDRVNCFDCRINNSRHETYADPECRKSIEQKRVMKCIEKIQVKDVLDAVYKMMSRYT